MIKEAVTDQSINPEAEKHISAFELRGSPSGLLLRKENIPKGQRNPLRFSSKPELMGPGYVLPGGGGELLWNVCVLFVGYRVQVQGRGVEGLLQVSGATWIQPEKYEPH